MKKIICQYIEVPTVLAVGVFAHYRLHFFMQSSKNEASLHSHENGFFFFFVRA